MPNQIMTLRQRDQVHIGDALVTVLRFTVQESRSGRLYPRVVVAVEAPPDITIRLENGERRS